MGNGQISLPHEIMGLTNHEFAEKQKTTSELQVTKCCCQFAQIAVTLSGPFFHRASLH